MAEDVKEAKASSKGRVTRGPAPRVKLTEKRYRKALPELRRDFGDRCAYCMKHLATESEMQVEHFDPRQKKDKIQNYSNLFLAGAHCNGAKHDAWPTKEEQELGCRFLNCCEEQDYDGVIFEDPETHLLVGTSVAARYHIETIDLNDPGLVAERKKRFQIAKTILSLKERVLKDPSAQKLLDDLAAQLKDFIPIIKTPPGTWISDE